MNNITFEASLTCQVWVWPWQYKFNNIVLVLKNHMVKKNYFKESYAQPFPCNQGFTTKLQGPTVNSWLHPLLSLVNDSGHPPAEARGGAFSCIRKRRHWCQRLLITQEDSLLFPSQMLVNLTWQGTAKWYSKLPWKLRRCSNNRKGKAGCLLMNKSFNQKMSIDCGYIAAWYMSGGTPQMYPPLDKLHYLGECTGSSLHGTTHQTLNPSPRNCHQDSLAAGNPHLYNQFSLLALILRSALCNN